MLADLLFLCGKEYFCVKKASRMAVAERWSAACTEPRPWGFAIELCSAHPEAGSQGAARDAIGFDWGSPEVDAVDGGEPGRATRAEPAEVVPQPASGSGHCVRRDLGVR